jgi:hypothetical protein
VKRASIILLPVMFFACVTWASPQSSLPSQENNAATAQNSARPWERGDGSMYQRFFQAVSIRNKAADEAEKKGMNSAPLRATYQRMLQLNPAEMMVLDRVVADLDARVAEFDAKAEKARNDHHVELQTGRQNGQPSSPPPPGLQDLPVKRQALAVEARDQLRQGLGEAEFKRVDDYLHTHNPWQQYAAGERPPSFQGAAVVQLERGPDGRLRALPPQQLTELPERIAYRSLFQTIANFNRQSEQERAAGLARSAQAMTTTVPRAAGLNEEQTQALNRVATIYFQAYALQQGPFTKAVDAQRKMVLDMTARDGKVTPTSELTAMNRTIADLQHQMDTLVDNAVQDLHAAFGDEAFARFDAWVKKPGTKVAPAPEDAAPPVLRRKQ